MAETNRGSIYPVLPGNCPGQGYILQSKKGFMDSPLTGENLEWVKNEKMTDADKDQIYENKRNIESLEEEVANIETALDDKSEVSGTNDGTNWTKITINGVEKNIPAGGGGGEANVIESISVDNVAKTITNKNVNFESETLVFTLADDSTVQVKLLKG